MSQVGSRQSAANFWARLVPLRTHWRRTISVGFDLPGQDTRSAQYDICSLASGNQFRLRRRARVAFRRYDDRYILPRICLALGEPCVISPLRIARRNAGTVGAEMS